MRRGRRQCGSRATDVGIGAASRRARVARGAGRPRGLPTQSARSERPRPRPDPAPATASTSPLGDRPAVPRVDALVRVVAEQPPAGAPARVVRRSTAASPRASRRRTGPRTRAPGRDRARRAAPAAGRRRRSVGQHRVARGPRRSPMARRVRASRTRLVRGRSARGVVSQPSDHDPPTTRGPAMFARLFAPTVEVSAHCDLPCGVYDPAQARIEAESIKAIIAKVADNDDPDFRTRADPHQGAALRAGQAPPLGAVDRLLQAPALREVPAAAHARQRGHQARRRRRHQGRARRRRRPTSCSPRSTRSPRSSGRPRRPEPVTLHRLQTVSTATGHPRVTRRTARPVADCVRGRGRSARPRLMPDDDHGIDRHDQADRDGRGHRAGRRAPAPGRQRLRLACCAPPPPAWPPGSTSPIDDIEDLRIAVGEACAMVLPEAAAGSDLTCRFSSRPAS